MHKTVKFWFGDSVLTVSQNAVCRAEGKRSEEPSGVSSSTTNPVGMITSCHTVSKTNARREPNMCNKLAGNFIRGCNLFKSNCKIDHLTPADVSDTSDSNPHQLLNTKHLLRMHPSSKNVENLPSEV